jgi:adenylate cyclase
MEKADMTDSWALAIYENQQLVRTIEVPGPAEVGRQGSPDEPVDSCRPVAGGWRVVVASKDAKAVPRRFFQVQAQQNSTFRISNLSASIALQLSDGRQAPPGGSCLVDASVLILAGDRRLRLQAASSVLLGLDEATLPPGHGALLPPPFAAGDRESRVVLRWLRSALDVLQSAATSGDFFDKAAEALVSMVRLDSGGVLLRQADGWQVASGVLARPASQRLLQRVCQDRRTFWEKPEVSLAQAPSLKEVEAVVAAPILDRGGAVLGVLYGDRRKEGAGLAVPITEAEALLVELLACGVAAALARLEQEKKALASQVRFEQFFTPALARCLADQPDLLKGRDAEVTVLFCDVRGFSLVSERLGPEATMDWVGDVMNELSACVLRHEGVLVDYVGDELLAMWGVPERQPDHAVRACRAALDMLAAGPPLDERWRAKLGASTVFGIGVNTGLARVGNSGSSHKFKYGPLGNTVNLGSRVQGATKQLKCRLLITGATAAKLDAGFLRRRLCQVRVVNIQQPVELYELAATDRAGWAEAVTEYELALAEFERREFREAALRLAALRAHQGEDGPALVLLSRAVQYMVQEPDAQTFDPVWVLPSK